MSKAMTTLRPPLRWAGSKRRLLPELRLAAPATFKRYVEPFAGSACFFFALRPASAILNDINVELINFYEVLRSHPRLMARLASSMPNTASYYYELRCMPIEQMTQMERAARFLYLNRYCFNGVYRTNRNGVFNVPRGASTGNMPSEAELYKCSLLLRSAQLEAEDFETVLREAAHGDFVYLDPPYASVERKAYGEYGYGTFSSHDESRLIASVLKANAKGAKILLSYRDSPVIISQLPHWHCRRILVRRHIAGFAACRRSIHEVLLANFPLPDKLEAAS